MIEEGVYQIKNFATNSVVHTFTEGENVFVALIRRADPGNYGLWEVLSHPTSSHMRIFKNIALQSSISVGVQDAGVQTSGKTVPFVLLEAPTGSDDSCHQAFIIKHPDSGLVWTIPKLPFIRGHVHLRPENGAETQKWIFVKQEEHKMP
ncbi:hypothetical protein E1B28_008327 [Marasmius oreades]|uniref:Uncharacterized protein n=1 Tax=Marasmius oreades TaxID=181124 RepID=A0A9P7RYB0_9AGAR|nr:uncharacterized protein E1B28_008327 [Marasmius oreades]KAG7091935.1 hypothetical protein E1B28_008327 [Marasmius oreades]